MRVATSGDGTVALWTASRYKPDADLRAAWGKLFRVSAWLAAAPSLGLMFWSALAFRGIAAPTEKQVLAYFLQDYVAACGVGITALFASIALPRTKKRDVALLFGGCVAAVLAVYSPALVRAAHALRTALPHSALVAFLFPQALVLLAACAAMLGRRKKIEPPPEGR